MQLGLVLFQLSDVVEADQYACVLSAAAEDGGAVDDEGALHRRAVAQAQHVVSLEIPVRESPGPRELRLRERRAAGAHPVEIRGVAGQQLVRRASDDGSECAIGENDPLLEIEDHQTLGQRVECGAHMGRYDLGRVEVTEHPAEVEVEDDEAREREDCDQLRSRADDAAEPSAPRQRPEPQLHPPPSPAAREERHLELRVGRVVALDLAPVSLMVAHGDHGPSACPPDGRRQDVVVALHHDPQRGLETFEVPLRHQGGTVGRNRLDQGHATLAHRSVAVGDEPE
jgi:hypothetical protein